MISTLAGHAERSTLTQFCLASSQKVRRLSLSLAGIGDQFHLENAWTGWEAMVPTIGQINSHHAVEERYSYAPIGGIPGFSKAVQNFPVPGR